MAWEMTALAYPLDTAFALDAEVIDELAKAAGVGEQVSEITEGDCWSA